MYDVPCTKYYPFLCPCTNYVVCRYTYEQVANVQIYISKSQMEYVAPYVYNISISQEMYISPCE